MASGLFPALDPASLTSELCANPKAAGVPGTSTFKANCMQILGTAVNPSQDVVLNTDVYGSVKAGGGGELLETSTRPTWRQLTDSARLHRYEHEHSP